MPTIDVVKPFQHVVTGDVYGTHFDLGVQEVDERTAEVALKEGWAIPFTQPEPVKEKAVEEVGHPSPVSGPEKPLSSQHRGRPRAGRRSTRSGAKPD